MKRFITPVLGMFLMLLTAMTPVQEFAPPECEWWACDLLYCDGTTPMCASMGYHESMEGCYDGSYVPQPCYELGQANSACLGYLYDCGV